MRKYILSGIVVLFAGLTVLAGPQKEKKETVLLCTLTNEKVSTCCCEMRNDKLFCTKAQKEISSCCCKPVEK